MQSIKPTFSELFDQTIEFPDPDMQDRYQALVGLDEIQTRLRKMLGILVNSDGISSWVKKNHPKATKAVDLVQRRPPLIILAGDVGSGKSELAYTIGDAVAKQEKIDVTLYPLSLSTRGQGMVGQMTQLVSAAFDYTLVAAKKLKSESGKSKGAIILLVDEADALAQSRENNQMHHEDKAGVNAFIRGVDALGNGKYPAAVIMCTNRPNALDPAIRRRAAEIFIFNRPNDLQREAVLKPALEELGVSNKALEEVVKLTGATEDRGYGFTYSDLMQRLLPSIILEAYPDKKVDDKMVIEVTKSIVPTSPFKETE